MKKWVVFMASITMLFSCNDSSKFKISGKVGQAEGKMLYLDKVGLDKTTVLDSAKLSADGEFKFKQQRPEFSPEFYQLRLGNQAINIAIDSTESIEIKATADHFADKYEVTGSQNCIDMQHLSQLSAQSKLSVDLLFKQKKNGILADSLIEKKVYASLAAYKKEAKRIIFTNPNSAAAYFALLQRINSYLIFDPNSKEDIKAFGAVATAFDVFRPKHPRTEHLRDFTLAAMNGMREAKQVEITTSDKANTVGSFEIELPDIHGSAVRLSSLKGKVVVLNFTAYKSKFSPALNMLFGEIYTSRKDRGLEIYQVSLDDDDNFWKVSASHLPWKCVRDVNGSNTTVAQTYNVSELPTIFLINKAGEIVSRVQNPKNLQSEIDKLL